MVLAGTVVAGHRLGLGVHIMGCLVGVGAHSGCLVERCSSGHLEAVHSVGHTA